MAEVVFELLGNNNHVLFTVRLSSEMQKPLEKLQGQRIWRTLELNPFVANVPILYPLETPGNLREYKIGAGNGWKTKSILQAEVVFRRCSST